MRSSGPSESITCQSNPQMMSKPRVLRPTNSCSLTLPSCYRSRGSCRSLLVPRRLEAEEDAAEAGVEVAEVSVEVEEVEALEVAGVAVGSTEEAVEEVSEGGGVAEVSEEGVEDKLNCCLSLISIFFQIKYILIKDGTKAWKEETFKKSVGDESKTLFIS